MKMYVCDFCERRFQSFIEMRYLFLGEKAIDDSTVPKEICEACYSSVLNHIKSLEERKNNNPS